MVDIRILIIQLCHYIKFSHDSQNSKPAGQSELASRFQVCQTDQAYRKNINNHSRSTQGFGLSTVENADLAQENHIPNRMASRIAIQSATQTQEAPTQTPNNRLKTATGPNATRAKLPRPHDQKILTPVPTPHLRGPLHHPAVPLAPGSAHPAATDQFLQHRRVHKLAVQGHLRQVYGGPGAGCRLEC